MKKVLLFLVICFNVTAQTLDQQQTGVNGTSSFDSDIYELEGQIFTAGMSGPLTRITMKLASGIAATYTATLNLYPTDTSGIPIVNTVLATATVTVSGPVPPFLQLKEFTFAFNSPYTIKKDKKYAFAISAPSSASPEFASYSRDAYPLGNEFLKFFNQPIIISSISDVYFKTFVNSPLPIRLISFTAHVADTQAVLEWQTSIEHNASHFEIQRSQSAQGFETIGRVTAQGNTEQKQLYKFIDSELAPGLYYYRLRSVDLDKSYSDSPIIAVRVGSVPLETLTLSPNPSSGPLLIEHKNGMKLIRVYSASGALIKQHEFTKAVDRWSWAAGEQPAGVYIVQVDTQDGKSSRLRWVKQ